LPKLKADLAHKALRGELKEAKAISDFLYPINKVLFCESNPIPIKAAMYIVGLIDTLEYRLPLLAPSIENMNLIEDVLKQCNIEGIK
jgi:4-hydroxy-tetrahydrodipicolinate synthase